MFILGEISLQPMLREGPDIEDSLINDRDKGEPPPDLLKRQNNANSIQAIDKRYSCLSCEPPSCSRPTVCHDAVQCWKSRVRESTGKIVQLFYLVWYFTMLIFIDTIFGMSSILLNLNTVICSTNSYCN